jgi:hypothetical protein
MTPAEVFSRFTTRPQDVRVIAPRQNGQAVENNAIRFARSMGMQIEAPAQRRPVTAAQAFDKLPPEQALRQFPELDGALRQLAASKRLADRFPNEEQRKQVMAIARGRISKALHEGKEVGPVQQPGRDR